MAHAQEFPSANTPPVTAHTLDALVAEALEKNPELKFYEAEILAAYPDLEHDDIREALRYAAETVRERELPLTVP
jgi:outer membrane protein TolC